MKKYAIIFVPIIIFLFISCSSTDGSLAAMKQRYNKFLDILPDDLADKFKIDSKEYGSLYLQWQNEANAWIDDITTKEDMEVNLVKNTLTPDTIEYAVGMLTNKSYERSNPYSLMNTVYAHSANLGKEIEQLENADESFSNRLHHLKEDEAIINFSSEETAFYYLWNYAIMLSRPRRFQ